MSAWPPVSVSVSRSDLKDTISLLKAVNPDDYMLQSSLARYLVVRSAGFLESVRDDVADHYSSTKSSSEVTRRIRYHLRNGQGVAPNQMLDFVKSYAPEWHSELEALFERDDARLKGDLGALIAARKKIAHGAGENVTVSRALRWADTAVELSKWLVERFDPNKVAGEPVGR